MTQTQWTTLAPTAALAVCACSCPPLGEVPINAEDSSTAEVIRSIVAEFVQNTAPHDTCVRAIDVVSDQDTLGRWTRDRRIQLDASLEGEELVRVTRHELCHALDEALGYPSKELADDAAQLLSLPDGYEEPKRWAECWKCEAFAQVCEFGGSVAHQFSEPCWSDASPLGSEVFARLANAIWTGEAASRRLEVEQIAGLATEAEPAPLLARFVDEPDAVYLSWREPDGNVRRGTYDFDDGQLLSEGRASHDRHVTPELTYDLPHHLTLQKFEGSKDGSQIVGLFTLRAAGSGDMVRWLWSNGAAWALAGGGCLDDFVVLPSRSETLIVEPTASGLEWGALDWAQGQP